MVERISVAALLTVAAATGWGCGPYGRARSDDPGRAGAPTAAVPIEGDAGAEGVPGPTGPVVIEPAPTPPPLDRAPRVAILAPKANEAIAPDKADAFELRLDVRDWFVTPGEHIHVVLDNRPYKALEDGRTSIRLGDIFPNEPLAEGQHVVAAFAARADHVGVKPHEVAPAKPKEGGPFSLVTFWVGKPGKAPAYKAGDPALVYSRPKGTYNGADADVVLLDFYLANAALGDKRGYVLAVVTPPVGEPTSLRMQSWAPMLIKNLPSGTSRILLELRDKDDKPTGGMLGRIEREVSINREARGPTF
jgi:hypothetical protein